MDQGFQYPREICVDKSFPNDFCILNACLTNSLTQHLWIQNFLGRTQTLPSGGLTIYVGFQQEQNEANENKSTVPISPSKQLLFGILHILKTCAVRKCSQYGWRQNNPRVFYEHRTPPRRRFFIYWHRHMFTNAMSSLPIYSVRKFSNATSSLPDYSVGAFSDETSSLPDYSLRALFWQIEIWSGIYCTF